MVVGCSEVRILYGSPFSVMLLGELHDQLQDRQDMEVAPNQGALRDNADAWRL